MVFEKIKEIISESLDVDVDKITMETNLLEDLEADSLDLYQMISEVEEEFDVKIDEIENIKTVADVVKIIESK